MAIHSLYYFHHSRETRREQAKEWEGAHRLQSALYWKVATLRRAKEVGSKELEEVMEYWQLEVGMKVIQRGLASSLLRELSK